MKKNSKGFTLIELLAIIVILAIIAVITIPIILNVIENSRKGAAIDSAYGYKDAIEKYYVSQMIDKQDFKMDGFYTINEEGILTDEKNDTHTISISGDSPSGGYLGIENSEVVYECLNIGDYKVMLEDGTVTAEKGKCGELKLFTAGDPVYFNPVEGKLCTEADYKGNDDDITQSSKGTNSGCMKWYVLSGEGIKVDLILDHNTSLNTVAWNSSGSNQSGPSEEPGQLLATLKSNTDSWTGIKTRTDSYTAEWKYNNNNYSYTIDYSGYKARLISAEEINKITGKGDQTISTVQGYEFNTSKQYGWLYDYTGVDTNDSGAPSCKIFGCNEGRNYDPVCYWTSSANASSSSEAWFIVYVGSMAHSHSTDDGGVKNASACGVRPVITVSKSILQ